MLHRAPYDPRKASRPRYPYPHRSSTPPLVLELSADDPCLLRDLVPVDVDTDAETAARFLPPYEIDLGHESTD